MPHAEPLGPLYSQTNPPGIVNLSNHLLGLFPGTHSGGWYNPASSLSGGGPSPHRVTQALDVMCDQATAAKIIRYMVSIAESVNLQQVIAWHEIITVQRWGEGIRYYAEGDHSDGNGHAHIHVGLAASRQWDKSWVGGTNPPAPVPPKPKPITPEAPAMLFYQGAFHYFWIDANGDLQHKYPGGATAENMSNRYARPQVPGFGALDPKVPPDFHVHPDHPDVIIGTTRAQSGYNVEWIYFGGWRVASIAPGA